MDDDKNLYPGEEGPSCMFEGREGVCCDDYDKCDRCGFNPRVEARRKRKIRERRREHDSAGSAETEG